MSAVAVIYHPDAVHILTDMAIIDGSGVVASIGSKMIDLPAAHVAITATSTFRCDIAEHLRRCLAACETLEHVCEALPVYGLRLINEARATGLFNGFPDGPQITFFVAGMIADAGRPGVWIFSSDSDFEQTDCPVVAHAPTVDLAQVVGRLETLADVFALDPVADGLAIMEAQRAQSFRVLDLPEPIHVVGGGVEMTTVTAGAIERGVLRTWGDSIGARIDPRHAAKPGCSSTTN